MAFGYEEQMTGLTWEELSSHMGAAAEKVEAQLSKIQEHIEGGELGLHIGCAGWLANGWFVKGAWDTGIDWDVVSAHPGKFGDKDGVYPYFGTDGSSQEPCTCGRHLGASWDQRAQILRHCSL